MEQGPITLNFTKTNDPFPKGEIKITEKLETSCVKPRRGLRDLKIDDQIYESLKDKKKLYIGEHSENLTTDKGNDRTKFVDSADFPDRHKEFPFSAICALDIFFDNSVYVSGTGFMIGSRYILTTAHNIFQNKNGGAARDVYVSPGKRRLLNPFGVHRVTHAFLLTNRYKESSYDDLAVLAIDSEIGDYTGWFGMIDLNYEDLKLSFQSLPDGFSLGTRVTHVCGYDRPKFFENNLVLQSLKIQSGDLTDKSMLINTLLRDDILCYDIDTVEGQSGSPVWVLNGQNCYAIGVHNNYAEGQITNIGGRLTKEKISNICDLIGKQIVSFSNPFSKKAPRDLEEVLEAMKNCKNNEEKNRLIGFLSSYKHYRLIDPLQMKEKVPENMPKRIPEIIEEDKTDKMTEKILEKIVEKKVENEVEKIAENMHEIIPEKIAEKMQMIPEKIIKTYDAHSVFELQKDFEIHCKIFKKDSGKFWDSFSKIKSNTHEFFLKKENFIKEIQSIQSLEEIDSISLDIRKYIEHKEFETILKMLPKISRLYHLDIKIDLANKLELADLLLEVPYSEYFDLYIRQNFDDKSIQNSKDILDSILKKNPNINLYLEFEYNQFDIKQIDHTILKISNSDISKIYIYPLERGFCILVNDPRHKITESNIRSMILRKSIFRCVKSTIKSSLYEDEKFVRLLREIMNEKKFIQFGEIIKIIDYTSDHSRIANLGLNTLVDHSGLNNLIEVSLAIDENAYEVIDQRNSKLLLKTIQSIKLTSQHTKVDDNTLFKLSELILNCQNLKHLNLDFCGCDIGLKTLYEIIENFKSKILTFSVNFYRCWQISDAGLKEFSQSIQKFLNISNLYLKFKGNSEKISETGIIDVFKSIHTLSSLSNLALIIEDCYTITDAGIKELSQSIQNLSNISNLVLEFSSFGIIKSKTDDGRKGFSQSIKNLLNISSLTLNFLWSSDDATKEFARSIQNLSNISNLNLDFKDSSISDARLKDLSQSIQKLSNISNLNLNFRNCQSISDAGMQDLAQSIQHLSKIFNISLYFSGCLKISDVGLKELSQSIQHLSNLSNLNLYFGGCKSVRDAGLKDLAQSIQHLSKISNLSLSFRNCHDITDDGIKELSQSIEHLLNISHLTLYFIRMSKISAGIKSLSQSIKHLPNISYLTMNFDPLEPEPAGLNEFSRSIQNISSIIYFSLNGKRKL